MSIETDNVLSAIRRGEDSLPRLRAATGLEYAKLHPILHILEFEDRSIQRNETADGFDRYALMPKEGGFKGTHWKDEAKTAMPVAPKALCSTRAAASARALGLLQRNAPYHVFCRGICFVVVDPAGRVQWKCPACKEVFDGSRLSLEMAHIDPEPKITAMRERDVLGPEEEAALQAMRDGVGRSELGLEEEIVLAEMRGGELDEDDEDGDQEIEHWRSGMCRQCGDPAISKTGNICQRHQDLADAVLAPCRKCETPTTAKIRNRRLGHCQECYKVYMRQRRKESSAALPSLAEASRPRCGCGRPNNHGGRCAFRRQTSPSLADERAAAKRNGHAQKPGKNITETITSNGHNVDNANNAAIAENSTIIAEPKTGNGLAITLSKTIADKEAQIAVLESDIAALRRVAQILER